MVTVVADASSKEILVDGERYVLQKLTKKKIDGTIHENKAIFVKVDARELSALRARLKKRLQKKVDIERILDEVVSTIPLMELRRLDNMLKKRGTVVKRQDGCLGFSIRAKNGARGLIQVYE